MLNEVNFGVTADNRDDPIFLLKLKESMDGYNAYVSRGGVLDESNMPSYFLHDYIDISLPEPKKQKKKI